MILDTNALSAAADSDTAIVQILSRADQLAIPVVVLGEYRYGISQSRNRARYTEWLDGLLDDCMVLDVTEATTHHYAIVNIELRRIGRPIPTNDLWIAALGRQYGMAILSRDRHFDLVPDINRLHW